VNELVFEAKSCVLRNDLKMFYLHGGIGLRGLMVRMKAMFGGTMVLLNKGLEE
jgi:hypothetical protein